METPIGHALKSDSFGSWVGVIASSLVVSLSLALTSAGQLTQARQYSLAAVVVAVFGLLAVKNRDRKSFGFRLSPIQGWYYWMKMTILLGAIMFIVLAAAAAIALGILRFRVPHSQFQSPHIWPAFYWMCIYAPLTEEMIYRLAVCPPMTARFGEKAAIAISGITFAAVHVLGGNPGPDNQLAGFILAWAFLKSGSLAVPLALHSLGNLCALAFHVAWFYWSQ
jgi:membrane protease YdiL (CAAX protease family)